MSESESPSTSRDLPSTVERSKGQQRTVDAAVAPRARGSGIGWMWAGLGLALIILAGGFVGWLLFLRPAEKVAGSLRDTVAAALQKITGEQVTIASNTITLQKSNITELNVVQRKTQTMTKMETTVFGSKATLILRGEFVVKAGYDLSQPFSVTVNDTTGEVKANFPPAKITSVELKNYEVYFSDNGLINKITPEHQEMATKQMLAQARLDAENSDIKEEADQQLQTRLKDLLRRDAKKIMVGETQVLP